MSVDVESEAFKAARAAFWRYKLPAVNIRNPHMRANKEEEQKLKSAIETYLQYRENESIEQTQG